MKAFFPKISRFITERWKIVLVSLASIVLLTGIVFQALLLNQNFREFDKVQKEKLKIVSELSYWKEVAREYEDYRDAYFRIASLQVSLGNIDEAKKSLEKVLKIDPNFQEGRLLAARIGL